MCVCDGEHMMMVMPSKCHCTPKKILLVVQLDNNVNGIGDKQMKDRPPEIQVISATNCRYLILFRLGYLTA